MILMIDNYDSFTFNLVQALQAAGADVRVVRNDAITRAELEAMASDPAQDLRGIVISPGPGNPDTAGISVDAIRVAAEHDVPLLGVCLGMQSMAAAFGAAIVRAPTLVHGESSEVTHDGLGLLGGMPARFDGARYHSLCVDPATLPPELIVTARSEVDGVVMGLRHTGMRMEGVQFHPESVLTPEGPHLLANFLRVAGEGEASRLDDAADVRHAWHGRTARQRPGSRSGDRGNRPMSELVRAALVTVVDGGSLSQDQARAAMASVMDGEATPAQLAALLVALRMRGETIDELAGFALAMRERVLHVDAPEGVIDTCGTGGDGSGTFNISTAAALVVAGAGVPVAKHGNRAVTSRSGSADVLDALGIRTDLDAGAAAAALRDPGFAFLFAQGFHPAMKHAGPTRREIGIRTAFNFLGPLTNPAGARRQVVGVGDAAAAPRLAEALRRLGAQRAFVVHGAGVDELPLDGSGVLYDITPESVTRREIRPEEVGLPAAATSELAGGTPDDNAQMVADVLSGMPGPRRDVVLLNAGAALVVAGRASDLRTGIALAASTIDTGMAVALLARLREDRRSADEGRANGEVPS